MSSGQAEREPADSPWFQRTAEAANRGSPVEFTGSFSESQQSGLAAAIALAQADAAAVSRTPPRARPPWQPAGSVRGSAGSTAPARRAAANDLPGTAVYPASRSAGRVDADVWISAGQVGQQGAAQASRWLSYVQTPLLMVILTFQAVLSLRLVWSNTAFLDEATYLLAGHAEIAHWLHGTPVRAYAFSGSPVIYPPIAALAARLGGLAAARVLSLLCVEGTTALLWSTTRKLFGRSAAVCAATLFAIIGPTVRVGALATFAGLALLLLAASVWCVVSARDRDDSTFLLIAATVLLVLANATEYSTVIFDPSVVAIAGLAIARKRGAKPAVARSGYVAAGVLGLTGALLALAGPISSADVLSAIVRAHWAASAALTVLAGAWKWAGLLFAIAAAGVILCIVRRDHRVQLMILAGLATTSALALVTQAGLETKISLSEHIDFGAWFAAAGAGYAISRLSRIGRRKPLRLALAALILIGIAVPTAITGRAQSWTMFHQWPNTVRVIADLRSATREHPGQYLAEDYDVPAYYLESTTSWQQWSGTWYFSYTPPGAARRLTGLAAYRAAIDHHYFSVVVLDFETTSQTDYALQEDMTESGDYQVIKVVHSSVAQYTIWAYEPAGSR